MYANKLSKIYICASELDKYSSLKTIIWNLTVVSRNHYQLNVL